MQRRTGFPYEKESLCAFFAPQIKEADSYAARLSLDYRLDTEGLIVDTQQFRNSSLHNDILLKFK